MAWCEIMRSPGWYAGTVAHPSRPRPRSSTCRELVRQIVIPCRLGDRYRALRSGEIELVQVHHLQRRVERCREIVDAVGMIPHDAPLRIIGQRLPGQLVDGRDR